MGRVWTEEDLEKEDGLKIVARWARTEAPSFEHYGRFICNATDANLDEVAMKNPRCWRGGTLVRTDLMAYFAVPRENIMSQVDEICPADEGDTARREEAMAFVGATWAPLIERLGNGSYRALDIHVIAYADATGTELYRESFYDIEVNEEEVDPVRWTVMTLIEDNSVILDVRVEASHTLKDLLPTVLLHGLSMEQTQALILAIDFHGVNADEDADTKAAQKHLDRLKGMLMGGVR